MYLAGLTTRREQQNFGSQIVGTVVPYAQEYRELGANEGFLREVSELTGGGPLTRRQGGLHSEPAPFTDPDRPVAVAGGAGDGGAGAGDRHAAGRSSPRAARVVEDKEVATMARRTGRRVHRMHAPMLGLLAACALWAATGETAWAKTRPVLVLPYQSHGGGRLVRRSHRRDALRGVPGHARPPAHRPEPGHAGGPRGRGRRRGSDPAGPRARRQGGARLPRGLPAEPDRRASRSPRG